MATTFAGTAGAIAHQHNHSHDYHDHRHDPPPSRSQQQQQQHRRAQMSVPISLNGTLIEDRRNTGRASAALGQEEGLSWQQAAGGKFVHKHTPSLQLNGNSTTFPGGDASWKKDLAFSPPPLHEEFPDSAHSAGIDSTLSSHAHSHAHSHSQSYFDAHEHTDMTTQDLRSAVGDEASSLSRAFFSGPELLASILIPLPFALTAWLVSQNPHETESGVEHQPNYLTTFEILTISSMTLLSAALYGKVAKGRPTRPMGISPRPPASFFTRESIEQIVNRIGSIFLPFFAASILGSVRTVALILSAVMTLTADRGKRTVFSKAIRQNKFLTIALAAGLASDALGWTSTRSLASLAPGYMAAALAVLSMPLPFPAPPDHSKVSPLVSSALHVELSIAAGLAAGLSSCVTYLFSSNPTPRGLLPTLAGCACVAASLTAALFYANPSRLVSRYKFGYALSLSMPLVAEFFLSTSALSTVALQGGLSLLAYLGLNMDSRLVSDSNQFHRKRGNSLATPHQQHVHSQPTAISRYLIAKTVDWPILHSILSEDDSRPVFYFMLLNLTFMGIQAFYSVVTESLGLLSDSIHMFFDCFALAVGLAAAVMSKWPPSTRFPYGYGMLNVLAGFGNGVFLMLISIEIVYEAFERLVEGVEMNRLKELFIVSVLGMLVNLVGLVAMPHHHHHGHDHGHSHGHSHSHGHDHGHSHTHHTHDDCHDHDHGHGHDHSDEHDHHEHDHTHAHDHDHTAKIGHLHAHSSVENIRQQNKLSHVRNGSFSLPEPSPLGNIDINTSQQRLNPLHLHSKASNTSLRSKSSLQSLPHSHSHPATPAANSHSHSHAGHSHTGHSHAGHSHDHMNENMLGIWLHIAADALGSLSVVISTVLIHYTGTSFWDPLASILIALLIFASAIPLVRSCATRLLLTNSSELEFDIKEALQSVSELRGVDGVCVPKFWTVEGEEGEHGGSQTHGVVHVIVAARDGLDETRRRVEFEFGARRMQVMVQAERESEGRCWCGGGRYKT